MNPWTISRTALFIFLMTTMAAGADKTPRTYQKGTILNISRNHASCELEGIGIRKLISNCGNFQSGQPVDYRLKGDRVYIRDRKSTRLNSSHRTISYAVFCLKKKKKKKQKTNKNTNNI